MSHCREQDHASTMSWMHTSAPSHPRSRPSRRRASLVAALLLALLAVALSPSPAGASEGGRGGGDDDGAVNGGERAERLRVVGSCGAGASSRLELETKDGKLQVRFRVRYARPGVRWRIAIVQERRVVLTTFARTTGGPPTFELRRELEDLPGADEVTARAWGPRGLTCRASGILPE